MFYLVVLICGFSVTPSQSSEYLIFREPSLCCFLQSRSSVFCMQDLVLSPDLQKES